MRARIVAAALAFTLGCGANSSEQPELATRVQGDTPTVPRSSPASAGPEPWSDRWLELEASRYLDDPEFRRAALLASLRNRDNQYSRKRVGSYALGDRGWDRLPEWVPAVAPITDADLAILRETGELPTPGSGSPLWDRRRPSGLAEWVALGERVFFEYPLRAEPFAHYALANPDLGEAVGLRADADGRWPGVVAFADLDGQTKVGITCALCHVGEAAGGDASDPMIVGRARRRLDYGRMRLAYYHDSETPIDPELAARMASWGPGRADVTDDEDADPVAIPDLWQIRELRDLTQAATLRHEHPAALAIRQETQLLHTNGERARPPRELAWALAMYVYSLAPPVRELPSVDDAAVAAGRVIFDRECARCHRDATGAGPPMSAKTIGTDPALAFGHARGTGVYRPAPLVRVAEAGPYLHDGSVASLEELLSTARLEPDYAAGARGRGPVVGHRFGTDLTPRDRAALIDFLATL
ncbi:c-type cytochrome [Enhygromyxa salina]|uniref:Cytochrome c n=1 Tax=Enhygromyxa salina TaxID=215803 RepID=A0A2S9YVI7_9BACT|nr:c-type cytochrome [Enhygromyxa salina]PRQ09121.1 Cytochrome c [Enhygromyxa salina]